MVRNTGAVIRVFCAELRVCRRERHDYDYFMIKLININFYMHRFFFLGRYLQG